MKNLKTASQAFTEYYENIPYDEKYIYFKRFLEKFRSKNDLAKIKLKCNHETLLNFHKAKDCLITNLCMNESFLENDRFSKESFNKVYNLFKSNQHDETQLARILFLLHLSKSNVDYLTFTLFSKFFDSIELVKPKSSFNQNFLFLTELFEELKNNRIIQEHIVEVVKTICGENIKLNFKDLKLTFFNCSVEKLRGFAGINRIYIGIRPFLNMLKDLKKGYKIDELKLLMKLEFMRVFINITTHTMIRNAKNDLNYWNPKNFQKFSRNNKSFRLDAGYFVEDKIFQARINWLQSGLNENLKLDFWNDFYYRLMVRKEKIGVLKVRESGIRTKLNNNYIIAIDFS